MHAWGFTENDIRLAASRASDRLGHGTELELREWGEKGRALKFILRFGSQTSRLLKRQRVNDAEYPPGVLVRPGRGKHVSYVDPIPSSEVFFEAPRVRTEYIPTRKSCGAPCWHAFGHFIRCLFEINPEGRIKTAVADYRGAKGFDNAFWRTGRKNIGNIFEPLRYSDACDCYHYECEDF